MTRKYTSLPYTEYTVADGHFDTSRAPITEIVLHSSASTRQGLIDTFGGGTRMVSAHYGIDNDGSILAFLEEYNTAYHAGVYVVNQSTIGIEHIDNGANTMLHTDAQYETSIKLVADICNFYNIPVDSEHIIPHSQVRATKCPNGLDMERIIKGAKALNLSITPSIISDPKAKINVGKAGDDDYGVQELQAIRSMFLAKDQKIKELSEKISIAPQITVLENPKPSPLRQLVDWLNSLIGDHDKS